MKKRKFLAMQIGLGIILASCSGEVAPDASADTTPADTTPIETTYENVVVDIDDESITARNTEKDADGVFYFFLEDGLRARSYAPMAAAAADYGWTVKVFDARAKISKAMKNQYSPEACQVIGGLGAKGEAAFDFGFERRAKGVDGVVLVASVFSHANEYKGKISTATIVAGKDGIVPPDAVSSQHKLYPSQTYFLTIHEGNHGGFYPGREFDGDGVAEHTPEEQLDILGKIVHARMDRFCQTREKNILEAKRKAAFEKAKREGKPTDEIEIDQ